MNNKKEAFLEFLNQLMEASPDIVENMSDDAKIYLEVFKKTNEQKDKPLFTDNGKNILLFLQDHADIKMYKAKNIAEELGISSRTVSGAMRKLVIDGFVEKIGSNPVIYSITQKGKEIQIEGE